MRESANSVKGVQRLIAVDLPLNEEFVDVVRSAWESGDAVFPLDPRWPSAMRDRILAAIRPTHIQTVPDELVELENGEPTEAGDALVIATSGSTGEPKGVVHTFASLKASADACHDRIGINGMHWLACLPVAHIGGFSVVARSLLLDIPLTIAKDASANSIASATEGGANLISIVPTMLDRINCDAFHRVLIGGAKPPSQRPANAIATYGSTETGSGIAYNGHALKHVEIRIANDGAILVKGPMLMRSYRNASNPFTNDGWLDTGDAGELLSDGSLNVFGRRTEMIITGGENVWPDAVERALLAYPGISDCAVFGAPDPKWGETVCAVFEASAPIDQRALKEFLGASLPGFSIPKKLNQVENLPRTPSGKIDRRALSN